MPPSKEQDPRDTNYDGIEKSIMEKRNSTGSHERISDRYYTDFNKIVKKMLFNDKNKRPTARQALNEVKFLIASLQSSKNEQVNTLRTAQSDLEVGGNDQYYGIHEEVKK